MLSRDWKCSNCGREFHSYDHGEPPCPECGGHADWMPGGGHVQTEFSKGCERTVRGLADGYGMTNVNTPSRSRVNRAMPHNSGMFAQPDKSLGIKTFAPGFSSYFHPSVPTCAPSLAPPAAPRRIAIGQKLPQSGTVSGPRINTSIAGRHYPGRS